MTQTQAPTRSTLVRGGVAAWLGWLFDGLDGYLYVLVAAPFVAELLHRPASDKSIGLYASVIQAVFLVGWALGGGLFGRIGDRFGRIRTISLTILTYALFTGLSALSQTWWQLMLFRFLAALGIGGEWAAGASLVSETWPNRWRPWVSAALQSAYQCGILLASLTLFLIPNNPRAVFLVGVLPALITYWIRRAVPEPEEWQQASRRERPPQIMDLFRGEVLRTTILVILVCSASLITVWGYMFWYIQQLVHLPDVAAMSKTDQGHYISMVSTIAMLAAIAGNFFSAAMARRFGYRAAAATVFAGAFITLYATYSTPRDHNQLLFCIPFVHFFVQGIFGLFPLYIPPLFPTMLRATGAGFCYNIGRLAAAAGTLYFGLLVRVGDYRTAVLAISYVYLPAILVAFLIPELSSKRSA
ncbi:MAG TPA: MFS transporter, partial [Chthonomonadales bacterium]|nr:MFS transporter [Chthonomonadales bacterium]